MRALVTGAGGFAGRHLVHHLRGHGADVVAAGHDAEETLDFRLADDVADLVAQVAPDVVFHLAATSSIAEMKRDPAGGNANIVQPALNVLEAVAFRAPAARVVLVSSFVVYGRASRLPMDETLPMAPVDLFGAARAAVEYMTANYLARGVDLVIARPFDHTGPGQDRRSAIGEWVARWRAGEREIPVGDLELRRDYCDVRDVVAGYALLAERGARGEVYNLCSGEVRSMRELFSLAVPGASPIEAPAVGEGAPFARDVRVTLGSPSRIEALGWRRTRVLAETLAEMRA